MKKLSFTNAALLSIIVPLGALVFMTIYEWLKQLTLPTISLWHSHMITICVCTALTAITFQIALRIKFAMEKQADRNLRQSEARFKSIVENINDALYIHDGEGMILDVNGNACAMVGYSREELVGASLGKIVSQESQTMGPVRLQRLIETGSLLFEEEHVSKNGLRIPVQVSAKLTSTEGKKIVQSFVRNITRLKAQEKAMGNVQKLEALGVLAGGIAHDFNNLLGGIFGYVDIALMETGEKEVQECLISAKNTIVRARDLTQQLLTFAKGGGPFLKLGRLFPFVEETTRFALSGSNVSHRFNIPDSLWSCNFDQNQIAQAIDNIVINAKQAMPGGGVITVTAANETIPPKGHIQLLAGNYVRVSFSDQGTGIPKDILPQIFDPFFTTKETGHGLGLATCDSIMKRHHGCIDVESEVGKGSTFHLYLPATEHKTVSSKPEATATSHTGTGVFLVVDDEPSIRAVLKHMLQSFGYQAICKEDGKDALALISGEMKAGRDFAGMIFDLTIPGGMGGREAITEIRNLDINVPVFVASGYADDPVIANPTEYGFTASIRKPFSRSELAEMLNTHLGRPARE